MPADIIGGVVPGTIHIIVRRSKTDTVARQLPVTLQTDTGLNVGAILDRLHRLRQAMGIAADAPIFGTMDDPNKMLGSASTFIDRLAEVYFPRMKSDGFTFPSGFHVSGHSFRRGGITAIRDAARAAGMEDAQLQTLLMQFGRWRDPRSVLVYLVENWTVLSSLTRRL